MSSAIPVRKHLGNRRSGVLNEVQANNQSDTHTDKDKAALKSRKRSNEHSPQKQQTRHSSMRELIDENARQKEELKTQETTVKGLTSELKNTKEKLQQVTSNSEENEKSLKDLTQKTESLEVKCKKFEEKLLMSNIDPVTLQHLDNQFSSVDTQFEDYKKTQAQVRSIRDSLQKLNSQTSHSLETLMNMDKQLEAINSEMDTILAT